MTVRSAGGDDDRSAIERAFRRLYHLDTVLQMDGGHFGRLTLCAESFRALLHLHAECEAVDALFEAGVVVDL